MAWQLHLPESGRRVPLKSGAVQIGSAPDCAVRIEHPTVSRRHARLTVKGDEVCIEDLGSSNGTRVDGRVLTDSVRLTGPSRLRFGMVDAALCRIDDREARAAIRFNADGETATTGESRRAGPTLIAEGASRFALEQLPGLLEIAGRQPDARLLAAHVYSALRDAHPDLSFTIEDERGRILAGQPLRADAHLAEDSAGPFRIRAHGKARARASVGPALNLSAALLDLVDRIAGSTGPVADTAPEKKAAGAAKRPEPPTVNRTVIDIYDDAERVAPSGLNVLIEGETGTGKELLARYLHAASGRDGDFVAVNCAALSRDLLEAELFGIESGVATGVDAREGRFVQADRGTLMLDEITEMPGDCQAKLLRVLQEREVLALGSRSPRAVDVRVVAATNRRIDPRDAECPLRADLVHRLSGWRVSLPPLRDRIDDVPQLAAHFLASAATPGRARSSSAGISEAAMEALCAYDWPGNVRELEQEMLRAALFVNDGELLERRHLSPGIAAAASGPISLQDIGAEAQRQAVEQALATHAGNATRAAEALGISRATLYRRMREFDIQRNGNRNRNGN